jgi:hypothetical protein
VKALLRSDNAGGDCTTHHGIFVHSAMKEARLNAVKFQLRYAHGVHTLLSAITISGSIFLIDMGQSRSALRFDGIGAKLKMSPTLGVKPFRDAKAAEFQIIREEGKVARVLYKVLLFC